MDNKRTGEGGYTLLYNIYREGRTHPGPPCEGGREGERKTENGRSFYERRKAGREKRDTTKRKDKDMEGKILPSRAHEHVVREDEGESPGRTRASHPGEQGRVTREDKDESPGRTRTSHPGGQNSVLPDDKIGVSKSGKDVVLAIGAMHRVPAPWH